MDACTRSGGRGDDPGGRRQARDAAGDERLERVPDGVDDGGRLLGMLAQQPAERADAQGELERGGAIVAADRLVVRSDGDGTEASGIEDPGEPRPVRERERTRRVRIRCRGIGGRCFAAAARGTVMIGFSDSGRQQTKAMRPRGFSARRRLANPPTGSGKNITPKRE